MNRIQTIVFLMAAAMACGRVAHAQPTRLPSADSVASFSDISQANAGSKQPAFRNTLFQPGGVASTEPESLVDRGLLPPGTVPISDKLSLEELVQLALTTNPALAQAEARVQALCGEWVQVGLPPNPTAGYVGSEIGNEGSGGQQGGFIGQQFITGGKLRLNRAVLSQEIQQAEQRLAAVQMRVQTDVRQAFYAALIAQRRIELAEDLLRVSSQAAEASQQLLQAGEIPRAGLLQTQIEQQTFAILLQTASNEQSAAWQQMSAIVGSELAPRPLAGDVSELPVMLDWDAQLVRVTATSPEVSAAFAAVGRAQAALDRARAEPIPNVATQVSVQYDNASDDTIAGVQLGLPLPIWNRNQGGIRQAQAEVAEARRNAQRIELDLKRRLAVAFQQYANAHARAVIYTAEILPKSQQTYDLVQRGYQQEELGYLDLLSAQRTYSQANLAYLDALSALWASWTEIDGLLLTGSLATPSK